MIDPHLTRIHGWTCDGRPVYRVDHDHYLAVYTLDADHPIRTLPDGREVVVMPWSGVGGQLSVCSNRASLGWDDTWDYSYAADAAVAAAVWDGTGEPGGWNRHPSSGRRRPDGTEASEVIRP